MYNFYQLVNMFGSVSILANQNSVSYSPQIDWTGLSHLIWSLVDQIWWSCLYKIPVYDHDNESKAEGEPPFPPRTDFHIYYRRSDTRSDPVFVTRRGSSIRPFAACFTIVNVTTCRIQYRTMLLCWCRVTAHLRKIIGLGSQWLPMVISIWWWSEQQYSQQRIHPYHVFPLDVLISIHNGSNRSRWAGIKSKVEQLGIYFTKFTSRTHFYWTYQ